MFKVQSNALILLLFVTLANYTDAFNNAPLYGQSQTKKIYLKPRRRILDNFQPNGEAKLKMIFEKAPNTLGIRWFYGDASTHYLNRAEEPQKLDIKGNPNFKVDNVRSGNVLMYTLTIRNLPNNFPIYITTLFTYDQALYQYILETEIANPTTYQDDSLASAIWLRVPHETITINRLGEGSITIECMAVLEAAGAVSIGEVSIYKSELKRNKGHRGSMDQLQTISLTKISVNRSNRFDPTTGKYTYNSSSNSELRKGYNNTSSMRYELMTLINISNASEDDTGVYTCESVLVDNKIYSSSWVKNAKKSPPVVLFTSCEDNMQVEYPSWRQDRSRDNKHNHFNSNPYSNDRRNQERQNGAGSSERPLFVVSLQAQRPSCVRCSVFDSLMSTVNLQKNDFEMKESSNTTILDHHISVPEGALSELTITFLRPSHQDAGQYRCSVQSDIEEDYVNFEVKIAGSRNE